jgi:hypothetical protein
MPSVVLPEPLSPTSAVICPACTDRVAESIDRTRPWLVT